MVYNDDKTPDIKWLSQNIDKKFVVKYDPDDLAMIQLFEQTPLGLRRVAAAEIKIEVHRGQQEQEDWEAQFIKQVEIENKALRIERRNIMDDIQELHKVRPEDYGLNSPVLKGIESSRASKRQKTDIGQYQKKLSNAVLVNDLDDDYDVYDDM